MFQVCCEVPAAVAARKRVHGEHRPHSQGQAASKTPNFQTPNVGKKGWPEVDGLKKWLAGYGGQPTPEKAKYRTCTGRKINVKCRTGAEGKSQKSVTMELGGRRGPRKCNNGKKPAKKRSILTCHGPVRRPGACPTQRTTTASVKLKITDKILTDRMGF